MLKTHILRFETTVLEQAIADDEESRSSSSYSTYFAYFLSHFFAVEKVASFLGMSPNIIALSLETRLKCEEKLRQRCDIIYLS